MSVPDRDPVAAELERLSLPEGILSSSSPRSSFRMHGDTPARLRIWETIVEGVLAGQVGVPRNGKVALVVAGPPGASKSTRNRDLLGEDSGQWRTVDPDEVKIRLIKQVVRDQDYEQILRHELADGRPIMPMELAGSFTKSRFRLRTKYAGERWLAARM